MIWKKTETSFHSYLKKKSIDGSKKEIKLFRDLNPLKINIATEFLEEFEKESSSLYLFKQLLDDKYEKENEVLEIRDFHVLLENLATIFQVLSTMDSNKEISSKILGAQSSLIFEEKKYIRLLEAFQSAMEFINFAQEYDLISAAILEYFERACKFRNIASYFISVILKPSRFFSNSLIFRQEENLLDQICIFLKSLKKWKGFKSDADFYENYMLESLNIVGQKWILSESANIFNEFLQKVSSYTHKDLSLCLQGFEHFFKNFKHEEYSNKFFKACIN